MSYELPALAEYLRQLRHFLLGSFPTGCNPFLFMPPGKKIQPGLREAAYFSYFAIESSWNSPRIHLHAGR
jgi:hypothetical protein